MQSNYQLFDTLLETNVPQLKALRRKTRYIFYIGVYSLLHIKQVSASFNQCGTMSVFSFPHIWTVTSTPAHWIRNETGILYFIPKGV